MRFMTMFSRSAKELKQTRALVFCALMLAAQVALNAYVRVPLAQDNRVSIGYLATAAAGMLYGPVPAMMVSGMADIFVYLLNPMGPFFPGFTLTAVLGGLIYGLFFYGREVRVCHIIFAQGVIVVFLNMALNSLFISILYGSAFFAVPRFIKNLIQFPFDIALLSAMTALIRRVAKRFHIKGAAGS